MAGLKSREEETGEHVMVAMGLFGPPWALGPV